MVAQSKPRCAATGRKPRNGEPGTRNPRRMVNRGFLVGSHVTGTRGSDRDGAAARNGEEPRAVSGVNVHSEHKVSTKAGKHPIGSPGREFPRSDRRVLPWRLKGVLAGDHLVTGGRRVTGGGLACDDMQLESPGYASALGHPPWTGGIRDGAHRPGCPAVGG